MTRSIVLLLLLSAACTFAPAADNPQAQGGADIAYDLPRDAEVTINILDSKGWIVRELIRGENQKAGKQTVHWDGCDQSNRPLPPGDYAWKLIHHTGLNAEYVLSVAKSGQPPYRTDDDKGSWGGCLTAGVAVPKTRPLPGLPGRCGAVAQLGERVVRNDEVSGSIPLSSTTTSMA